MKLIILFIIIACLQTNAKGYSQTVNLSVKNESLANVFEQIEKQTHYLFIYTKEEVAKASLVTLELKNVGITTALDLCFDGQPLSYLIEDNHVVVHKKEEPKKIIPFHDIKGKVTNTNGLPLNGVTVKVKGSNKMTLTDNNGEFSLEGIAPDAILVISNTEMESKEIRVNGRELLYVSLSQKINELDETLVIGYGTTTKRFSTGSVSKITAADISKQPVANPLAALQGRVPGLVVTSTSGVPGASFNIQIRGQNSINPNPTLNAGIAPLDNPLFVIDGVPFAPQNANINQLPSLASPGNVSTYGNPYGGLSPFNSINPSDIESIEVLRDADATAIYGSRAANGVILITTKKGKAGKTKLTFNMATGQSRVTRSMSLLNTQQYRIVRKEAFSNDGIIPVNIPGDPGYAPDLFVFDSLKYTDWKDYFIGGSASATDINTTISGGTNQLNFLVGAGYRSEKYIFPGDFDNKRLSLNTSIRHQSINKRFLLEFSNNYSYDQNNSSGSPSLLQAFILPANYPDLQNADGKLQWDYNGVRLKNPLGFLKTKYRTRNYNLNSHLQVVYELLKGLSFRTSLGYNTFSSSEKSQYPKLAADPTINPAASAIFGTNDFQTWIIEPQADYQKKWGKNKLHVLLGGSYQQKQNSQTQVTGSNYSNDNLLESITAAGIISALDNYTQYKYIGAFFRANYVWNNKIILNINGRRDGSSRFGPGKQFGNFGSVGSAWLFSEEPFIKKITPSLSYGKLRASYGITGSDNIMDYQYLSRWASGLPPYQDVSGYTPQNLYNDQLHWSVNRKFEAGLELGIANNRILSTISWYRHRSGNQLVTYALPTQTGFRGVTANFPALVQNSGWEIQVTTVNLKSKNLGWTSSLNFSIPKNKLISFPGIETSSYFNSYIVGQPLNILNAFRYAGVNPVTGLYEFDSKNGTNSNPDITDRYLIGNLDPRFYGGFANNLSYKNIQLDIFVEFKKQLGANYLQQVNNFLPGTLFNQPVSILTRWQLPGDQTSIQKFSSQSSSPADIAARNFMRSSGAYSDASYVRIKTIALSYSLQRKWLNKLKMEDLRLYVNAQNLFTITNYKGNDPETRSFYSLPPLKTIVAGLQFTF